MHTETWRAYQPTASDPWDIRKVAHLHRRAGFGANWRELQRDLADGPQASITRLLNAPRPTELEEDTYAGIRRTIGSHADSKDRLQAYWLHRMLLGSDPLREKMTLFWHDHFATSNAKVRNDRFMVEQNETLRRNALGDFATILNAMLQDPALLYWLDGIDSPKGKPNENLARELLELFTMGPGHYSETDIRQAARALTGWTRKGSSMGSQYASEIEFRPHLHDAGMKTFLGKTGKFETGDLVDIVLEHPATAEFLAGKLYRYLVADVEEMPESLITELAQHLRENGYSVRKTVEIVLRSQHFFSAASIREKIASPVELSVGIVRILDVPTDHIRFTAITDACKRQGQHLFFPPNVAGWKGGRNWLNSLSLLQRNNWLTDVIWGNATVGVEPFDPIEWIEQNEITPGDSFSAFVDLLLQGDASDEVLELATSVVKKGDATACRKAVQILLSTPECQLS